MEYTTTKKTNVEKETQNLRKKTGQAEVIHVMLFLKEIK